jgi:CRISPR type I-E-associated protein CasB/Cse2
MTSTTTTGAPVASVDLDPTREHLFIRWLAAGHAAGKLGALHQWRPGVIDPAVIALTQDADRAEYVPWGLTAKAFALFHSGRRDVLYGFTGTGIGRWARRCGADSVATERMITALARAQDPLAIDRQLTALARMNTPGRFSPHWETVLAELVCWADPTRGDDARFAWSRDYYTFVARVNSTDVTSTD